MDEHEEEYKGYRIVAGVDPYADRTVENPEVEDWYSYIYSGDEMLDGGNGFDSLADAVAMAKDTIDRYPEITPKEVIRDVAERLYYYGEDITIQDAQRVASELWEVAERL